MQTMAKSTPSKVASLVLRFITLVLLFIALIITCTNSETDAVNFVKLRFHDVKAYRYMLSANVIGLVYAIVQLAFTVYSVISSNTEGNVLFNFYGDKVMSYLLATGATSGFAVTPDLEDFLVRFNFEEFYSKGYASASMLLLAFLCSAALSVLSSFALPKTPFTSPPLPPSTI